MLLDYIWAKFAVYEEYSSSTKQRAIRKRTTGTNAGLDIRDGRREFIEPVVMIAHNLEYDLGRLIRNHPQFRRVVLVGADTARVMVGKYEIEIAQLTPNGSAPAFEFYVRHNHEVVRLIGRDLWGYLKSSLADIGEKFLKTELKGEVPQEWFKRAYESFTDEERDKLNEYAAQDPKVTRLAYELLIDMLTSIDKHVICKTGLPPRSAPGAGAKMAFAMASVDEWSRPSRKVMEEGALTYAGARVFNRKPGYYENI